MSAPSPKKKPTRKAPLEIRMVTFEVPALFEGEFTLPDLNKLNLGSARKLQSSDGLDEMFRLCDRFDRPVEAEALEELGVDEVETFVEAWSDASDVTLPKSDG